MANGDKLFDLTEKRKRSVGEVLKDIGTGAGTGASIGTGAGLATAGPTAGLSIPAGIAIGSIVGGIGGGLFGDSEADSGGTGLFGTSLFGKSAEEIAREKNIANIGSLLSNANANLQGSSLDSLLAEAQAKIGEEGTLATQEAELKTQVGENADMLLEQIRAGEQAGVQTILDDQFLRQRALQNEAARLGTAGSGAARLADVQQRLAQGQNINQLIQGTNAQRGQISADEIAQLAALTQQFDNLESDTRKEIVGLEDAIEAETKAEAEQLVGLESSIIDILDNKDFSDIEKEERINQLLRLSGLDFSATN